MFEQLKEQIMSHKMLLLLIVVILVLYYYMHSQDKKRNMAYRVLPNEFMSNTLDAAHKHH